LYATPQLCSSCIETQYLDKCGDSATIYVPLLIPVSISLGEDIREVLQLSAIEVSEDEEINDKAI